MEVIYIFDLENIDKKIYEWVHEEPKNVNKIGRRALIVAVSPMIIGGLIALIIVEIITFLHIPIFTIRTNML